MSSVPLAQQLQSQFNPIPWYKFLTKNLIMLVPSLVVGNALDRYIQSLQTREKLGKNVLSYIAFQTLLNILMLQAMTYVNKSFMMEIQESIPGLQFTFFFNMQVNYIKNWQKLLNE